MRIEVAQDIQCVYQGVVYGSGETADVPNYLAQFWIESGWATAAHDDEAEPEPDDDDDDVRQPVVPKARQPRRSSVRRDPRVKSKAE